MFRHRDQQAAAGNHYRQSLTASASWLGRFIRCQPAERRDTIRPLVGVGTPTSHRGFKTDMGFEITPSQVRTWPHRLED